MPRHIPLHWPTGTSNLENGIGLCVRGKYRKAAKLFRKELDSDPDRAHIHHWRALALRELDRHQEAFTSYEKITLSNPDYAEAHFGMGDVLEANGYDDRAIACYDLGMAAQLRMAASGDGARVPEPLRAAVLHQKGVALYRGGQYAEAVRCYDQSIALDPHRASTFHNRGMALVMLGRHMEAVGCFDLTLVLDSEMVEAHHDRQTSLAKIDKESSDREPAKAREIIQKGVALNETDEFGAAMCFEEAVRLDPGSVDACIQMGLMLANNEDPYGAARYYERAMRLDPDNAEAHFRMGQELSSMDDPAGAIKYFDQAIRLDPKMAIAFHCKGVALSSMEDHRGAAECFGRAVSLKPGDTSGHCMMGNELAEMDDHRGAVRCYDRALESGPDETVYRYKAEALYTLGNSAEAAECDRKAAALNLNSILDRGAKLGKRGDSSGAIKCYEQAIELYPKDDSAYSAKGDELFKAGDYTGAVKCYEVSIRLVPVNPPAHFDKGRALYEAGDYTGAAKCFERAALMDPSYSNYRHHEIKSLVKIKDYRGAANSFEQARHLDPYRGNRFR